jgi:AcrR family transcriptional regulator
VLRAALAVMTRTGVDATELGDVATAAGFGLDALRALFRSKAELLEALAADFVRANGAALEQAAVGMSDSAEVVASSVRQTVRFADAGPVRAWLLRNDDGYACSLSEDLSRRLLRDLSNGVWLGRFSTSSVLLQHRAIEGAVLGVLRAKPHGQLPPDTAEDLAMSILQMLGLPPDEAATIATRPPTSHAASPVPETPCQVGVPPQAAVWRSSAPRICHRRRGR